MRRYRHVSAITAAAAAAANGSHADAKSTLAAAAADGLRINTRRIVAAGFDQVGIAIHGNGTAAATRRAGATKADAERAARTSIAATAANALRNDAARIRSPGRDRSRQHLHIDEIARAGALTAATKSQNQESDARATTARKATNALGENAGRVAAVRGDATGTGNVHLSARSRAATRTANSESNGSATTGIAARTTSALRLYAGRAVAEGLNRRLTDNDDVAAGTARSSIATFRAHDSDGIAAVAAISARAQRGDPRGITTICRDETT